MTDDRPPPVGGPPRLPSADALRTVPAKHLARDDMGSPVATLALASAGPEREADSSGVLAEDLSAPGSTFRALRVSRQFGRYELLMEVSAGGMATLYLARLRGPDSFEKVVAIKRIHDHLAAEQEFVDMFLDEARIAARIQHPHVATLFDMGQESGSYFIAMEYVHGNNLGEILREAVRRKAPLPWDYAVRMVADVARGLHAAHELKTVDGRPLQVVHRDVSPQNILVSYEGHVKVVDFGIAAAAEKTGHTRTGVVKGKAAYMSPEQTEGLPLDRRSDLFSLGVVLWEAVCLRRLFRRESEAATLLAVRAADVPRPTDLRPALPQELERILLKALARRPEDRFSSAEELAERLEGLLVTQKKTVTTTSLARLLQELFRDRIQAKEIQLRRALTSTAGDVMKSLGTEWSTGTSIELDDAAALQARRRTRRVLVTAGLVVAAAAVIGLGIHLTMGFDGPVSSREGATPPLPADPGAVRLAPVPRRGHREGPARGAPAVSPRPRPSAVTLHLTVEPRSAAVEVVFRGRVVRANPFTMLVPRSDQPESLEIRAPGFETRTLMVIPLADLRRTITLPPRARRVVPPRARPPSGALLEDLPP